MKKLNLITFLVASIFLTKSAFADGDSMLTTSEGSLTLTVPSASYLGIPGYYQNAIFTKPKSTTTWQLSDYEKGMLIQEHLQNVSLIVTEETPIQVFVKATGEFVSCYDLGNTFVEREGNEFHVYIYYDYDLLYPPEPIACTANVRGFSTIVQLPVYGLETGQYSYTVNGVFTGAFDILMDNVVE